MFDEKAKEVIRQSIPRIEVMIEMEQNHLNWLNKNCSSKKFIRSSANILSHLKKRLIEYKEYIKTPDNA